MPESPRQTEDMPSLPKKQSLKGILRSGNSSRQSEAEAVHAKRLLFIQDAVGSTEENLQDAIEAETYEFTKMYPNSSPRQRKSGRTRPSPSSPTP